MDKPEHTWIVEALARDYERLDVATLIPIFSSVRSLGERHGSRDKEEERNLRILQHLLPQNELGFRGLLYKPPEFIHPFESYYYSLPGYLDAKVLPHFCRATDSLAEDLAKHRDHSSGSDFLAFVYMLFLLIHPLPDANGRTARKLLDYYNKKLGLGLRGSWNAQTPTKFSKKRLHKRAFGIFFEKAASLAPRKRFCTDDPWPIPGQLRPHLLILA